MPRPNRSVATSKRFSQFLKELYFWMLGREGGREGGDGKRVDVIQGSKRILTFFRMFEKFGGCLQRREKPGQA